MRTRDYSIEKLDTVTYTFVKIEACSEYWLDYAPMVFRCSGKFASSCWLVKSDKHVLLLC